MIDFSFSDNKKLILSTDPASAREEEEEEEEETLDQNRVTLSKTVLIEDGR